jgi:hypothetical protein
MGGSAQDGSSEESLGVRAAAFAVLLEEGKPVEPERLSRLTRLGRARLDPILVEEEQRGSLRRDDSGTVVVCGGISLAPTHHRITFGGKRRFTCCAYDALGILGALGTDGEIDSVSPETGTPIRVRFLGGRPQEPEGVLFFADDSCCESTLEDWCQNVNLFEDDTSAMRWSARSGVAGRVLGLEEATEMGARAWSRLLDADPSSSFTAY